MAHLFRKVIPAISISAVQNLSLIASCPLWAHTLNVDFLQTFHMVAKYPFDFPMIPIMVITPFELEFPVFQSDDWIPILDYHEESLAYHVWRCCPPIQNAPPGAATTEESVVAVLDMCGCHALIQEQTMGWQQSHPLLQALFARWIANKPTGSNPCFAHFPYLLSCVLSRLISPFDLPLATSSGCTMTASQFLFYWHKAVLALDRKIGPRARAELLTPAFSEVPRQGGRTHTFKGDVLLTLLCIVYMDYYGLLQNSLLPVCQDMFYYIRSPQYDLCWAVRDYLEKVYLGQIRESFLDLVFHFFILDHLSLPTLFPEIFTRQILPVDWSFFFTPTTRASTTSLPFSSRHPDADSIYHWNQWSKHSNYSDLITSMCFTDGTVVKPFQD